MQERYNDCYSTRVAELSMCAGVSSRPLFCMCPFFALCISHSNSGSTHSEKIYHALLWRYQLDIVRAKIEVRRTIESSRYPSAGVNAAFIEGFFFPPSSFDEPIASAISSSLGSSNLPIILPTTSQHLTPHSFSFSRDSAETLEIPGKGTRTRTSREASRDGGRQCCVDCHSCGF